MSDKVYSEMILGMLIDIARRYADEPDARNGIVARCYQEMGILVTGEPAKSTLNMNMKELTALKTALWLWRKEKHDSVKEEDKIGYHSRK